MRTTYTERRTNEKISEVIIDNMSLMENIAKRKTKSIGLKV